ncbi:MAG: hypothetical protein RMM17_11055 [Acidobacteriota bacterium]|nr:hypothetical protein [Blastocatellia bacterium]MDW8413210.1 hypothetical protein [Acidobacteriota bacterium]
MAIPLKKTMRNRNWTAFEVTVLKEIKAESIAIPFAGSAKTDWALKTLGKKIVDNDICKWAWWVARARVENNSEQLSQSDVDILLAKRSASFFIEDLERWFHPEDVETLSTIRANLCELGSSMLKALAIYATVLVGDYALCFDKQTWNLKRPLSEVFREMLFVVNRIVDNRKFNFSFNLEAVDFLIRTRADLLYMKLPLPGSMSYFFNSKKYWREVWLGNNSSIIEEAIKNSPSANILSKERYMESLTNLLEHAKHFPTWAIGFQEGSPLSFEEVKTIVLHYKRLRRAYLKDFSECLAGKACIIVAGEERP